MSAAGASAGAAAAAAAEAKRLREQEEEEMTGYTPQDLAGEWEFKIVRSMTGAFKHAHKLRETLEQEAKAGWALVEKFDNSRVRLKRPAGARANDAHLEFDPYRTYVGPSEGKFVLIVLGAVFGGLALIGLIIALIAAALN